MHWGRQTTLGTAVLGELRLDSVLHPPLISRLIIINSHCAACCATSVHWSLLTFKQTQTLITEVTLVLTKSPVVSMRYMQSGEIKSPFVSACGSLQRLGRKALMRLYVMPGIIAACGTLCVVCWLQSLSQLHWFHLSELKLTHAQSQCYLNLLNSTVQPRLPKLQLSETPRYSKQGQVS